MKKLADKKLLLKTSGIKSAPVSRDSSPHASDAAVPTEGISIPRRQSAFALDSGMRGPVSGGAKIVELCDKIVDAQNIAEAKELAREIKKLALLQLTGKTNDVVEVRTALEDIKDQLKQQCIKVEQVLDVCKTSKTCGRADMAPLSYAQIASFGKVKEETHSMVLSSVDPVKGSNELEGLFKRSVNVRSLGVGVSAVRHISGQKKLLVSCPTAGDRDVIFKHLRSTSGADIKVEESKKKNPIVAIRGIIKSINEQELNEYLFSQNKIMKTDNNNVLKIRYRKKHRNSLLCTVVCSCPPELYSDLLRLGRISIGYQRLTVEDESPLTMCFKCQQYGHIQKVCRNAEACAFCMGGHASIQCPDRETKRFCINCRDKGFEHTHSAFDRKCQVRIIMDTRARSMIEYPRHC